MNDFSIYSYLDYKEFTNEWIKIQKKAGHGQLRKMSLHLNVNSVIMTQVFRGDRDLTLEQAFKLCSYIGLDEGEKEYFLLLVQKNRAGTVDLEIFLERQIQELRDKSLQLKNRINHEQLSDESKARFYSQWYYSGIRQSFSLPSIQSIDDVAEKFRLKREIVVKVVEFLLKNNLLIKEGIEIKSGPQVTHIGAETSFVTNHHKNWRLKAIDSMGTYNPESFHYTGPMSLSQELTKEIHDNLVHFIKKNTDKIKKSENETLRCLNIDWFEI